MSERNAYLEKLRAQLNELTAELDKLEARAQKVKADMRLKYDARIKQLRDGREDLRKRASEITDASDEAWKDLKKSADKAWRALKEGLKKAKSEFKGI